MAVADQLETWRNELLDLSTRNPLINIRPGGTLMEFASPSADRLLRDLLDGETFTIVASGAPRPPSDGLRGSATASVAVDPAKLASTCRSLRNRARTSEQEQGITTLFATVGLLSWREPGPEGPWRSSPLLLVPVRLQEDRRTGAFTIVWDGNDPAFNTTLAEKVRQLWGPGVTLNLAEWASWDDVARQVRDATAAHPDWSVNPSTSLGIFQFHKQRMHADLEENATLAADHPVVQTLLTPGATFDPPAGVVPADRLDHDLDPTEVFTFLDADASQLRAIQAALAGANLVIQGPPGTGKSQTIANLIAEMLAAGKTVLFVSEKAAALDVVHRRLDRAGLAPDCLVLHSHTANRREVVQHLSDVLLEATNAAPDPVAADDPSPMTTRRDHLRDYVDALHTVREPFGLSAYALVGRLTDLGGVALLRADLPDPTLRSAVTLQQERDALARVAAHADTLRLGEAHPWAGTELSPLTHLQRTQLAEALRSLAVSLPEIGPTAAALADVTNQPAPATLAQTVAIALHAHDLIDDTPPPPDPFAPLGAVTVAAIAGDAAKRAHARDQARERLLREYRPEVLTFPAEDTLRLANLPALRRWPEGWWRVWLQFRSLAHDGRPRSRDRVVRTLQSVRGLQGADRWFASLDPMFLGTAAVAPDAAPTTPPETWERLAARAQAALVPTLPVAVVDPAAVRPRLAALDLLLAEAERDLAVVRGTVGDRLADSIERNVPFADAAIRAAALVEGPTSLQAWTEAQRALAATTALGLGPAVEELLRGDADSGCWVAMLDRTRFTHLLSHIYEREPILGTFDPHQQGATVEQFAEADEERLRQTPERVRQRMRAAWPTPSYPPEEAALVRKEAAKQKGHLPLRQLFEQIPTLLPRLKPCLMMSPASVAQYLPTTTYQFDLVVFDEASQVRRADALGAILRGRQVVVAGDRNQLPPTTFFEAVGADDPDDADAGPGAAKSILDEFQERGTTSLPLLWHYRSRDEGLIAFSNEHIYRHRLVTFPNPAVRRSESSGVHLRFVGGVYEPDPPGSGGPKVNRTEARAVAEAVAEHLRTHPGASLGVVALGQPQRDLIEEELANARRANPALDEFCREDRGAEPFFVKALEQVQGDERDVIVISIGYGPDSDGKFLHNFGPLSQVGGERRLNVLITRARQKVLVVSSIRGADIDPQKVSHRGPRLLKTYLDYAEAGPSRAVAVGSAAEGTAPADDPFRRSLAATLRARGWTVRERVGASVAPIDLAVVHPDDPSRYLLGIDTDGPGYRALDTVRDRDRLRPEVLTGLGWDLHRAWSVAWSASPARVADAVEERLRALLAPPGPGASCQPRRRTLVISADGERLDRVPVPRFGSLAAAPDHALVEAVAACVVLTDPLAETALDGHLAGAWGHGRIGDRERERVRQALSLAVREGKVRRDGTALRQG